MRKFLNLILVLLVFLEFPQAGFSNEQDSALLSAISPLYEEMFAHQVHAFYSELIKERPKSDPAFSLIGWDNEDERFVKRVVSKLNNSYGDGVDWKALRLPDQTNNEKSFHGIVFVGFGQLGQTSKQINLFDQLSEAAKFMGSSGREGLILVLVSDYMNRGWLDSIAEEEGFKISRIMALRELEFVEDHEGRQIVNLDLPRFQNPVYEQLVRGGMNPVNARLEAGKLIERFRRSEEPKILVLDKKNP